MNSYQGIKRIFDLSFSFICILMLSPVFIILGCLIVINDRPPVIFRHNRVGRGGRIFSLYKFRTMTLAKDSSDGLFEPGNTSRVTSLGRFLRKTKLDELPQLINVLKGDMSFVGPRPEVEEWTAVYPEKWGKVLTVRPGITDQASVEFHDEEKLLSESEDPKTTYRDIILPRKLDLCMSYVDNYSLSNDLRLILITLKTILRR
jgi:lipopolysaccharide/colanic/teichoic acid biosynthesis glycosyltransferase